MDNSEPLEYEIFNGVTMKPGIRIYCSDRDSPNYDQDGVITSVSRKNGHYRYEVKMKYSTFEFDSYDIEPYDTNTDEAIIWRMERTLRIFLCHGSEDKAKVREIYSIIKSYKMRPWLDEEDIKPGQDWDTEIRKAVEECHIILVLLSSSSVRKEGYIQQEIRFALDRAEEMPDDRIFIIPVRLDDCQLPLLLQKWQSLDFFNKSAEAKLMQTLKDVSEKIATKK